MENIINLSAIAIVGLFLIYNKKYTKLLFQNTMFRLLYLVVLFILVPKYFVVAIFMSILFLLKSPNNHINEGFFVDDDNDGDDNDGDDTKDDDDNDDADDTDDNDADDDDDDNDDDNDDDDDGDGDGDDGDDDDGDDDDDDDEKETFKNSRYKIDHNLRKLNNAINKLDY